MFTGRTIAEAPIFWPPDGKNWLTGKYSDAGKDWRQKKGATKDEMVEWPLWLNGHEFEQSLGDSEGQGSLAFCSQWGHKESDTTEWLNKRRRKRGKERKKHKSVANRTLKVSWDINPSTYVRVSTRHCCATLSLNSDLQQPPIFWSCRWAI